ncbi:hypothetical protein GI374_02660 [Paracoccus sp. S-4012]|uniref:hypothetical protein n=1 Tax=Paracoccus sp. S-4012 TaxID=2665648 RepID=UPI0012B07A42|nr:hypothetical protein [Paracoccus sp. S-4012]MRX49363.1 hypothetical protein [Paracoccus sp. S-4012]
MIGVVVWSCDRREQAVIWCDDHAALAFLSARRDFCDTSPWPQPGDMMELAAETLGSIRHARAVRPLAEAPRRSLPALLKGRPAPHLSLVHSAEPVKPSVNVALPPVRVCTG